MSSDRLLDAQAIEEAAKTVTRPTARLQLESLAKKMRKEAEALQRVEGSVSDVEMKEATPSSSGAGSASTKTTPSTPMPVVPTPAPVATPTSLSQGTKYTPIDRFSFDAGKYDAPYVTLYIPLPGVGDIPKESVQCSFTKDSFDLIVRDLQGKSYRLLKTDLEKDIDPAQSKYVIKADKVLVKLHKVKTSEYGGYDYWTKLTDSKKKKNGLATSKDNPQAGIMQMMKDMYEEGDDNMRKVIGESFMKQQRGELGAGMPDMGDL